MVVVENDVMIDRVGVDVEELFTKVPIAELELERLPVSVGRLTLEEFPVGYKPGLDCERLEYGGTDP